MPSSTSVISSSCSSTSSSQHQAPSSSSSVGMASAPLSTPTMDTPVLPEERERWRLEEMRESVELRKDVDEKTIHDAQEEEA
ncbi:hypothetical protein ADUPG1_005676, partial [Aduncisulcus paluster]